MDRRGGGGGGMKFARPRYGESRDGRDSRGSRPPRPNGGADTGKPRFTKRKANDR